MTANAVEKKGSSELDQVPVSSKRKELIEIDPLFLAPGIIANRGMGIILEGF